MAIFRIEKTKDFTVMSNHHLRNTELSLKAKGLLSQILSLPEDWDYTLTGLCYINRESKDAIRTAINELERAGYIERHQTTDEGGKFSSNEYIIHESPISLPPPLDKPSSEKPMSENPTQLNKDKQNTEQSNTDLSIYPDKLQTAQRPAASGDKLRVKQCPAVSGNTEIAQSYRELLKENIEYDVLCSRCGEQRVDGIVELMLETMLSRRPTIRIAGDDFPRAVVGSRFLKLRADHIEYVFDCLDRNTTKIRNIKAYLLATLYNASITMDSYYRAEVNHDLFGSQVQNAAAPQTNHHQNHS